jgi:hypothetical protein
MFRDEERNARGQRIWSSPSEANNARADATVQAQGATDAREWYCAKHAQSAPRNPYRSVPGENAAVMWAFKARAP